MTDFLTEALAKRWALGIQRGLDRIVRVLTHLGLPDETLGVRLVVGGTNGKGSTCAFLEAMLSAAGLRVGHYSSPHIYSARERILVDGRPVSDQVLLEAMARTEAAEAACQVTLTGFEWITVVGALAFSLERVQVSVLEVGLGGRLDAVNALQPQLTVLTPVDYDHCDILGPELAGIVHEKTALFRQGAPGVVAAQGPEAQALILGDLELLGPSPLLVAGRDFQGLRDSQGGFSFSGPGADLPALAKVPLGLPGSFQTTNAAAAVAALALAARTGLLPPMPPGAFAQGLSAARKPGRLQRVPFGGKTLILDAGHNGHAARALVDALLEDSLVPDAVLTGLLATKEPAPVLDQLARLGAPLHLAPIPDHACHAPEALLALLPPKARGQAHQSPAEALQALLADPTRKLILCFGSHYLLGSLLRALPDLREAAGL